MAIPIQDSARWTAIRKRLEQWAPVYRYQLIESLERGGAYGTVPLDKTAQFTRFTSMTEPDYEILIQTLNRKYQGLPDQVERVNNDLARFIDSMIAIALGE